MPEVFVSYRREDSSGHAGRIFDCLRNRFGDESVFMDVTDIEPGVDFTQALDSALSSCRVVLVVIGTQWLTSTDSSGRRRLDDPGDHVRLEIVRALARGAHVIPVLVRGAPMPREQDLPADLRPLARRQAHELSDSRWPFDTDQLLHIVERDLGLPGRGEVPAHLSRQPGAVPADVAPPRKRSWIRISASAAIFAGLLGLVAVFRWFAGEEPPGGTITPPPSSSPRPGRGA